MMQQEFSLADVQATETLAVNIAQQLEGGLVVYLEGELGAGKTTLVRALLRGLGVTGAVRSPTYTLIEQYEARLPAWHLDLYRLADPEELDFMGIRDVDTDKVILLVEWPQQGAGFLPTADWLVQIEYRGDDARQLRISAQSTKGEQQLKSLV